MILVSEKRSKMLLHFMIPNNLIIPTDELYNGKYQDTIL